jgi:hypothetical protein
MVLFPKDIQPYTSFFQSVCYMLYLLLTIKVKWQFSSSKSSAVVLSTKPEVAMKGRS